MRTQWGEAEIELALSCDNPDEPQAVLELAVRLFDDRMTWSDRVNDYAVEKLLDLKNDSWLDDDEEELSREAFLSKMTLQSITIDEAGEFTFMHDDGDLFFGHAIEVRGNLADGLTLADIPG